MEIFLAVVALFLVTTVALGVVAVVRTKRAVQRSLRRHVPQARRLVEDTTLRARRAAYQIGGQVGGQAGAAGEITELRLSLRESLDSTRRVLEAGSAADASLGESLALCARLEELAHGLDGELKLLEREPGRERAQERLPGLRERAERVKHSADSLRWAAQDRARKFADDELAALTRQCELEAGALRHWTDPGPAARIAADGAAAGGAGSGSASAAASGVASPEAIGGPDPRRRLTQVWRGRGDRKPFPGASSS